MATLTVGSSGTYATIQAAVNAAANGDTIEVAAGVYLEQVTVANFTTLTIIGAPGAIVRSPAGALVGNGATSTYGGPTYANIAVNSSTGVTITGIEIDGDFAGDRTVGTGSFNGATDEISGIVYINSSGTIDDVTVRNISNSTGGGLFGLQLGSAIFIDGVDAATTAVSITNSTISDFQKTAILVLDANVTITGNSIDGIGFTTLTAQNAIQLGDSQGTVSNNVIDGFGYDSPPGGPVFEGAGIIAYDMTGPLVITGNSFTGSGAEGFAGAFIEDINTTSVTISNNTVSEATFGFYIYDADMTPDNAATLSNNTFINIANAPVIVENATTTFNVTDYTQLVAALAAAEDGDVINLAAGTYTGPLAITDNVTINGTNAGVAGTAVRGAESIIDGAVTSNDGVRIDGVQFLNSSNNNVDFNALTLSGPGNSTVTNSVFFSVGPNGNNDRAVTMDTSASGQTTISNSYFTGASNGQFSTASWSRGVWSDGASSLLTVSNNTFEFNRTAMNLDGFNNAATVISGNRIIDSGSGISIGTPTTSTITGITNNVFSNVGTDFNLRNVTTAQSFDLTATNNTGGGTGAAATLVVLGTAGADTITGSAGADILDARDSSSGSFTDTTSNTLNGGGGNDTLIGSLGGDVLNGGAGNDTAIVFASGGTDTFNGGADTDTLDLTRVGAVTATANGATTTYSYTGGSVAATGIENVLYAGTLTVNGGATDDVIVTGSGNETINGNDGNDTITAGAGNDQVNGGNGNDIIIAGSGAGDDFYDGGAGIDTLVYSSTTLGVVVDMNEIDRSANSQVAALLTGASLPTNTPVGLATGPEVGTDAFRNIENVTGGSGNDLIRGNAGINTLIGGGGDDRILGGGGNDVLDGGLGNDTLDYSNLTEAVQVNLINGLANGGAQGGLDTISGFENIVMGAANDQFIGSEGENNIIGGAGDDQIDGRGGFDTFIYQNVTATDGMAQQAFDVLRVNAGAAGNDTIQRVERVLFINGNDLLFVSVDSIGNALVASRDDAGAMNEGDISIGTTAVTGVLANDVNLDQGAGDQKVVSAVNGSAANIGVPIVGTYGTLTLNANGSYTYVQNQAATNALSGGETVTDTFAYTADDGDTGDSAPANLVFTITGANDLPTLGGTNTGTLTEDTNVEAGTLSTGGTLTITDPDDGEATYQPLTTNNENGLGTFSLLANGSWTYSVNNNALAVQQLGAGQSVTDSFTAVSFDGSLSQTVSVTINGVNDNPVVSGVTFTPIANPAGSITVLAGSANDSIAGALGIDGNFSLAADANIGNSTTVPHVTIFASTAGEVDYYRFTVATAGTVTFDIDNTTGYVNGSFLGDTFLRLFNAAGTSIASNDDTPGDPGSVGPNFNGNSFLSTSLAAGTYFLRVSLFPDNTPGTGSYQLHVSLPGGTIGTGSLPGNALTETNAALSTSGTVNFSDVDLNDAPTASYDSATGFSFALANGPTLTAAQQAALASAFSIEADGDFAFTTPSPDYLGADDVLTLTYTVTVVDQHGGSTTTPVVITINGSNDRPVITSTAQGATLTEAADPATTALTASGAVTATDVDNGDVVAYTSIFTSGTVTTGVALTGPQQAALVAAFTGNPDGTWAYNLASPDYLPAGSVVTLTYTFTVTDGNGGVTTQPVVIVINGSNDAPTILAPNMGGTYSPTLAETDAALSTSGKVNFSDVDINSTPTTTYTAATDATVTATGITLTTAQIDAIKAGFVLVDAAGNYTFNLASPDYLAAGDTVTATFNVHVVDGQGGDTVQPITITITGTNDAPVLTGGALFTIADTEAPDEFAPITGTIAGAATDVDTGDTKSFTLDGPAESDFGTLTLNTDGTYSFAVNNAAVNGLLTMQTETVTYTVIVTDSAGATSTANFTITITGQNEDPVFEVSPLEFFTADFGNAVTLNLLEGASDPDNVEVSDLDIDNAEVSSYTTSGNLTSAQNSLVDAAVAASFSSANYDEETGTVSFSTGSFDFLDPGQSVTVTLTYTVTDSNGGSAEQTAIVTIDGILENSEETQGTPFDDYIVGGQFGDIIFAEDGDDIVYAADGADVVYAGGGDDFVDGASGADTIFGGEGDDEIVGGSGNDTIYGDERFLFGGEGGFEAGDNTISGGSGSDTIYGGLGNNTIAAGSGNDDIYIGSAGFFFGGEGGWDAGEKPNNFEGGEGGIELDLPSGINLVDGGSGFDTVHVSGRWSDYTITRTAANTYVFERMNEDGTVEANRYQNVEFFTFMGGEGTAAELANDAPTVAATITFSTPEIPSDQMVPAEGVFIGNVGASDPDEALGDVLSYVIDGSGANNFEIDEDGNLLLVNPIDFETQPRVYTLSLLVTDERGLQATSTITVNITDANDPVSALDVTGGLTSPELAAVGTVVATAAGTDVDAGSTISYSLSDNAGGRYAIDAITGVITVANGNLLDFEQSTSHSITVVATSNDESSISSTVIVAVTDVSPETIVGTSANETFVAGAGSDSFTTDISTGGADSVNFGAGLDRVTVNAAAPTTVLLRFTSGEVGNGNANDSNTLVNQDGGLAVRMTDANNVEGPVSRTDDEGMVFIGGMGVTFNVTDLPTGVSRGNAFEVAILGTSAADTLTAVQNTRPYYFNAGAGNDSVTGGTANDFLVGGGGDDVLAGLGGNNSYIGGAGIDTVDYSAAPGGIYVDLIGSTSLNGYGGTETFVAGIENVIGSAGNDIIIGDNANNVITGGGGSDYLIGRDGNDRLISAAGVASALQGGIGDDTYVVANAGDSVLEFAGEGIDSVLASIASYTLNAEVENLTYTGTAAFTGAGNGLANGLTGGTGNDTLTGGAGADVFNAIASNGLDVITDFTSGSDRIVLDASYTQTAMVDFVSGAGAQTATGTNSAFLYDTSTGILSYDADGTGAGAAVALFNLGAGTTLVAADVIVPPILP